MQAHQLSSAFGLLLREHRMRKHWSQAALAEEAEISTRHLSYLETGKSSPSREMVLVLTSALDLPFRERNALLGAAGFSAAYREGSLEGPELSNVRKAIDLLLEHHEPYPAMVVDSVWNVVNLNRGGQRLFAHFLDAKMVEAGLAANAFRLIFHPLGIRSFVENWNEVASHGLDMLRRETRIPNRKAIDLLRELERYEGVKGLAMAQALETPMLELRLRKEDLRLRFFTTVTTLGTPHDVTAQELRIESYFPADAETRVWLEQGAKA